VTSLCFGQAVTYVDDGGRPDDVSDAQGGAMRLVICDGSRIFGEALAGALAACGHEAQAVTTTADGCIAAVTDHRPDVCALDLQLPAPGDGLRALHEIRGRCVGTAVLVLSNLADPGVCAEARRMGIAGHLHKDRSVSQIADVLYMIGEGEAVFDPVPAPEAPKAAVSIMLTPREAEVLRRIVEGQDTRQMAAEMNISLSTLRTYVKNVLAKVGAHSRLEAAAVASRAELPAALSARRALSQGDDHGILHTA
jgi:two-component system, NarL family, nitrate/nitrite response regulator NarL